MAITLLGASALMTACKKEGCTDSTATNYNEKAKKDDGTCIYPEAKTPVIIQNPVASNPSDTTTGTLKAPDTKNLVELGSAESTDAEAIIRVYGDGALYTGYNKIYVVTLDRTSGELLNQGKLMIQPIMDMGNMKHSAPFVNPEGDKPNAKGLYECFSVFIMPGSATQKWTLKVTYQNQRNSKEGKVEIPLDVKNNANRVLDNFMSPLDSQMVFVSWKMSANPQVGVNDFTMMVHYRKNMMEFPPLDDLIIEIEPEMPSMGHGSPNNVNPVFSNNGTYQGKVNFTMTGLWKISLKVKKKDGTLLSDKVYFEYTI